MERIFLCFPEFKTKAVTLSYDAAARQDKRLIDIMKTYGLRGTFNVNSGLFANRYNGVEKGQMTRDEALKLYVQEGKEVAIHGYQHISLAKVEPSFATFDVINDRKELECMFGIILAQSLFT